ncbi:MAG TPA: hypothetical protein EYG51_16845 [Pseudomonadales bacterium]|nr:hypothetical protein [Pseudomonadales bacterium]
MKAEDASKIVDDLLKRKPEASYTDDQLFAVGFRNRYEVEKYLTDQLYGARSLSLLNNRKVAIVQFYTDRVWTRMQNSIWRILRIGGKGIYSISERSIYRSLLGYSYAESREEATRIAGIFFTCIVGSADELVITFIEHGDEVALKKYNDELLQNYCRIRDDAIKKIATTKLTLSRAKIVLQHLEDCGTHAPSQEE